MSEAMTGSDGHDHGYGGYEEKNGVSDVGDPEDVADKNKQNQVCAAGEDIYATD